MLEDNVPKDEVRSLLQIYKMNTLLRFSLTHRLMGNQADVIMGSKKIKTHTCM